LIPHTFFPRSFFGGSSYLDPWQSPISSMSNYNWPFSSGSSALMPSMLDMFDPFEDLDQMLTQNLRWIREPENLVQPFQQSALRAPQRHRITIDCAGFKPESIKTDLKDVNGQKCLCVSGQQSTGASTDNDYSRNEFKKSYMLPANAQYDKMVSYMTPSNQFIVEFPLTQQTSGGTSGIGSLSSLIPQIVDTQGGKCVQLKLPIPANVDPNKCQVTVRGNDLIVRCEDKQTSPDSYSRVHIYTKTRLPENTDYSNLKCTYQDNFLNISAPVNLALEGSNTGGVSGRKGRNVQIEQGSNQSIQQ